MRGHDGPAARRLSTRPEINSNVVPLPGVTTPDGVNCQTVPDPNSDLTAWTNSFQNIKCYDTLKVNAILNGSKARTTSALPAPKRPPSSA